MAFRITYSVLNADLSELNREFDQSLATVRGKLGEEFPSWIAGKALKSGKFLLDRNPARHPEVLAKFHSVGPGDLDTAFGAAHHAQASWRLKAYAERSRIIRKAADLISARRLEISAIMALETGKNRLESLGDVEEAADLFRYYATQLEEAHGFDRPLAALSPNEKTRDVLRPYGVFVVLSPFNFPLALAAGMSGAALLAGNAAILKPSQETPWCAQKLYECLRDAGLPEGLFQVVHGEGSELGRALVQHPRADGIAFTGSKKVGMEILQNFSRHFPKPCLLELGGKNPTIVCESADLSKAVEGVARSAFGLSGQKCSALSRVYVHKNIKAKFVEQLIARAHSVSVGDPTRQEIYMGPVINESAYRRFGDSAAAAKSGGKILFGGQALRETQAELADGWFVAPTIVEVEHGHALSRNELFLPFLTVHDFSTLPEALQKANDCDYGLTAGIFSERKDDLDYFMDHIEAGILYANRQTGATTGAWPGVQSFCGWKGSGATGKGGCGPYYVAQFMREQSQTRME